MEGSSTRPIQWTDFIIASMICALSAIHGDDTSDFSLEDREFELMVFRDNLEDLIRTFKENT